jgi:hypothetical protein
MKSFNERLLDYMETHPLVLIENVYDEVLDRHKRAIWKMQHRIKNRIDYMLTSNEPAFFITLTFSDKFLPTLDEQFKTIDYVNDFMKLNNVTSFVANNDFGGENGRFHWHAVVQSQNDLSHVFWKYGAINFKRIPKTSLPLKLSRYLIKLQRHAVKVLDPLMIYYPLRYKNLENEKEL